MKKAVVFLLSFVLVLSSFLPQLALAETDDSTKFVEQSTVVVLHDTDVYDKDDDSIILGEVVEGTTLRAERIDNGKVYIQWNDDIAVIEESAVERIELQPTDAPFIDEVEWRGAFTTLDWADIQTPDGDVIARLNAGVTYSYTNVNDDTYEIVIGKRVGYVHRSLVQDVAQDSETIPEPADDVDSDDVTEQIINDDESDNSHQQQKLDTQNVDTATSATFGKYFEVIEDNVTVYDNSTGKLVPIGTLIKGEQYPRVRDYGNWHRIQFGDRYGYVRKSLTKPADGKVLKNINNRKYKNSAHTFQTLTDVTVYDNTSGKLVPFAIIHKGETHPVVSDYGNWWRVDVSDRIGYVRKSAVTLNFTKSMRYFRVTKDNLTVYDNSTGKLVPIGTLVKGEQYPRVRDYGNWHEIKFGNTVGYVRKSGTEPVLRPSLKNADFSNKPHLGIIKVNKDNVAVYDNTGKTLIPFAFLTENTELSYIRDYGNWWEVNISNRIGYVHKASVSFVRLLIYDVVNPKQNYSYSQMEKDIATLKQMYPDLIQTEIIGTSVDGRNIYAIKLGKGKTEIFLNGSHHAREHITTNLLMEMIDQYAQAYVKNKKIDGYNVKTVLDRTSIWFVPMVNPDGVMLVQQGSSSAKNPKNVLKLNNNSTNFRAWKANVRGVDLNRQYPANWENIRGNPGKPGPMNYKGKAPFTEPEVRAIYNFVRRHDFKTAVAYHSTGEVIYWNFHQKGAIYTRDHNIAKSVARKTGYRLIYPGPNPSGGGFTDWFILTQKKPALTIEVSPYLYHQPVPIRYFDRIWKQNHSVGLLLAHEAYVNRNKR